ncbi:inorganic triphosphatase, partial [Pseudomonas aeruginosa]
EADRLYGELAKLMELLQQPVDAERLADRATEAHTVLTLNPWKALMK